MVEPVKNGRNNFLIREFGDDEVFSKSPWHKGEKMFLRFPLSFLWFKSYYNMIFSNTFIVNLLQELSHIHWRLLEGCLDLDSFLRWNEVLWGVSGDLRTPAE